MIEINKKEIKNIYKIDLLSELHITKTRLSFFKNKYKCSLEEFEKKLDAAKDKEDFEKWDELLEWKAYAKSCEKIKEKLEEINNENFTFTG
jgi:hypothetical protein